MSKKGEIKRQHYVPRFILRNFSDDGKRLTAFVLDDGERIDGASIKTQCYEDYFYGEDCVVEKTFAAEESDVAGLLADLSRRHLEGLPPAALNKLRSFLHYQQARTVGAAEHTIRWFEAFAKKAIWGTAKLNGSTVITTEEDLDLIRVRPALPQDQALWGAVSGKPILFDMAVKFIETTRNPGFVIADHPVVAYNQFAEHDPHLSRWPSITGLAAKGLQLFLPLSPSITLAVFDPSTYEFGGKSLMCRAGPQDVKFLNEMQAVNAWKCIYAARSRMDDDSLRGLKAVRDRHPSVYEKKVFQSDMIKRGGDQVSQFVAVAHPSVMVGAKLSFVRQLDGHFYGWYDKAHVPVRSPEVLRITEAYRKLMDEVRAADHAATDDDANEAEDDRS